MARALYEPTPEAAARIIAAHLGYRGEVGGWIRDRHCQPVCQGYRALAARLSGAIVARQVTDPRTGAKVTRYAIAWARLNARPR